MRFRLTSAFVFAVFILAALPGKSSPPAKQDLQTVGAPPGLKAGHSQLEEEAPEARQQRQILARVRALGVRLSALPNTEMKVRSLATVAGALCQRDPIEARQLLRQANETLRAMQSAPINLPDSMVAAARTTLISEATGCDPALAAEVPAESAPRRALGEMEQRAERQLHSAERAMESNPKAAAELLLGVLQAGGSEFWQLPMRYDSQVASSIFQLSALRERDRAAADAVFTDTVARLRTLPSASAANVHVLGGYVFGSPQVSRSDSGTFGEVSYSPRDIPADVLRSDSTPGLARAFLDAATDLLLLTSGRG